MNPESPQAERNQPSALQSSALQRSALYGLDELERIWPDLIHFTRRYWTEPEKFPVYAPPEPGDVFKSLPESMPEDGTPLADLLVHFESVLRPGLLHWNHPGFFGFFPCNTSAPSVASAVLSATLNINPFSWNAGPAATELEARIVRWFAREAGLDWEGSLQDTASSATLCAVLAARERARRSFETRGKPTPALEQLFAYVSAETHNSVTKALHIAGIPRKNIRILATREDFSLDPQILGQKLREDCTQGGLPFFICSTIGSTSSSACDDIRALVQSIQTHHTEASTVFSPWHHVDAACAGSLILLPEKKHLFEGLEDADSFVFNPHKWLFTHFECSVLLVKNRRELTDALSDNPSYLRDTHTDDDSIEGVTDFRNWSVQLGRGFRSLKLWFVLKHFGKKNIQERLQSHLSMTQTLAERFQTQGPALGLQLLCWPQINTICFRRGDDESTRALHKLTRERGVVYLTPTTIRDQFWIRIAIGQTALLESDIETLWCEIAECCRILESNETAPQRR